MLTNLQKTCRLKTLSALRRAIKRVENSGTLSHEADGTEIKNKLEIAYLLFRHERNERNVYLREFLPEKIVVAFARRGIFTVLDVLGEDLRVLRKILRGNRIQMPEIIRYLHLEK